MRISEFSLDIQSRVGDSRLMLGGEREWRVAIISKVEFLLDVAGAH